MAINLQSGASSDQLTIDPLSKAARAALYHSDGAEIVYSSHDFPADPHGLLGIALNDGRAVPLRADRYGSIATATRQALLDESFEGGTINPIRWLSTATTMAATQSSVAGFTFNSGNIVTATTGYLLNTPVRYQKTQRGLLHLKIRARIEAYNNSVMEFGFGDVATFNGAHTTGAYFQITSTGVLQGVVTNNSVDITTSNLRSLVNVTDYYTFDIYIDDDEATFFIQNTTTGNLLADPVKIALPSSAARLFSTTQLPVFARLYNTGVAPSTAPHLIVTDISLGLVDDSRLYTARELAAIQQRTHNTNPFTGVQAPQYANSASPTSATLSNTTAGYTTLGGTFQFAAVGSLATDYALFGFQVPTPANFCVTGVTIDTWNTGAAVATTPTLLQWAIGVGSTAVSLATATVTRVPLGSQSLPIGAAIGANAAQINRQFSTPLVCGAGRFIHIILRMPIATATASQVIAGMVAVEGYWL